MSEHKPLNAGDVVQAAFKVCGARWKDLLKVTAKTVLPASVFGLLLVSTFMPNALMDALGPQSDPAATEAALRAIPSSDWVNLALAFIVYVVASSVATALALGASIFISIDHHAGGTMTDSEALKAGWSKVASLFWLMLVSGLGTIIGFIACLVPGVWLFVSWAAAPAVLLVEGLKGTKALRRSFRLVKPHFWMVFAVVALELVTIFVLQAISGAAPSLFLSAALENNSFASFFALGLSSAIAGLFGVALHATISTELYYGLVPATEPQEAPAP